MPPLKAEDFVVEGLTADEEAALAEGAADDAAVVADNDAKVKADGEGDGAGAADDAAKKAAADKVAADKAAADKAAAEKVAAEKAAAEKAAAEKKAAEDAAAGKPAVEEGAKTDDAVKTTDVTRDTATEVRAPRQAVPDWQAPADADAQLKAIDTQRDALADKFDKGEISAKELFAQQRQLDGQARHIESAKDRAEMATEMVQAVWLKNTVPTFLDANTHYRDNASLHGMLDTEVRRLQVEAAKKGEDPLDPSILRKADEAIKASLGALGLKPAAGEKPAADAGKEKIDAKTGKPEIPPTLGKIPAADMQETDSQWATLDRLGNANPEAYEAAYAKLTDAQREAYLARG